MRDIDELLDAIEARLPLIVRRAVETGLREAFEDLQAQQRAVKRFVSLADAEGLYGISRRQLVTFIKAGKLGAFGPGRDVKTKGKVLVDVQELDQFILQYRIAADANLEELADEVIRTIGPAVTKAKAVTGNGSGTTRNRKLRPGC